MSDHIYDPNDVAGNEAALAATLAAQGIKYGAHATPPMTMPTTEIVSTPMTMPTTEIVSPAPMTMPTTQIVGKLAPGQVADPPPVAVKPGAIGAASPFVDDSAMRHQFINYGSPSDLQSMRPQVTPIANGPSLTVDTSGVTAPNPQGFPAMPVAAGAPAPAPAPGIAPAQYVPAGFDYSRVPTTPETQADILQTYDAQAAAQKNMAVSQADASKITADQMQQETARANQSLANQQAKEDVRQQFVKERLAKLQTLSDASLNAQVDPHEWWASRSALQTVAAGISIAIGGGIAATNGGHNPGLDMINSAIQQNIDAQKTNIQLKQSGLSNEASMLEAYRSAFGDERLGDLAFEHAQRQNAISQMQADAMKSQAPQITAASQNAIAQLQRQQDMTKAQFEQLAYVRAHMVGGPGALHAIDPGRIVKLPNGETVVVPTVDEGRADRTRSGLVQNIIDNFDRALKIRDALRAGNGKADLLNPYSQASKDLKSLKAETAQLMTVARGQGAMSKGDQDVADQAMGAFDGMLDNNDDVIRHAASRWKEQFSNEMHAQGGEDVKQGYRYNAKGELEPAARYTGQNEAPKPPMPAKKKYPPSK